MASWPSVGSLSPPDYGMNDVPYRPLIKTPFEANYTQTRAAATRTRRFFSLSWGLLPEAEFQVLDTFVNSIGGEMFGYVHPVTAAVHTCTIGENGMASTIVSPGFRSARVVLEEV